MRVSYFKGYFTEKAAKERFPEEELIPSNSIEQAIMAVEEEKVDYGVAPLENFYNGEVRETIDNLVECDKTKIVAEVSHQIIHCLGALPDHEQINRILSKDQALEQCRKYISEHYPFAKKEAVNDTSEAAQIIRNYDFKESAAISSEEDLRKYKLEILDRDILPNNKTKFVILGREETESTGDDKTLLVIHPKARDEPGTLVRCLDPFADYEINLEYIQSRPDKEGGYYFYLELKGHRKDEKVKCALAELDPEDFAVKWLGSYKDSHWKD